MNLLASPLRTLNNLPSIHFFECGFGMTDYILSNAGWETCPSAKRNSLLLRSAHVDERDAATSKHFGLLTLWIVYEKVFPTCATFVSSTRDEAALQNKCSICQPPATKLDRKSLPNFSVNWMASSWSTIISLGEGNLPCGTKWRSI